jgi:hypothetical protein
MSFNLGLAWVLSHGIDLPLQHLGEAETASGGTKDSHSRDRTSFNCCENSFGRSPTCRSSMETLFCAFKSASVQPTQGYDIESDFGRVLCSVFDHPEHHSVSLLLLRPTARLEVTCASHSKSFSISNSPPDHDELDSPKLTSLSRYINMILDQSSELGNWIPFRESWKPSLQRFWCIMQDSLL